MSNAEERENQKNALTENTNFFKEMAILSADWYWELDADLRFTWFSSVQDRYETRSQHKHHGKCRWELPMLFVDEEKLAEHRAELESSLPFRNFEYCMKDSNCAPIWYSVSGNPVFSGENRFLGYRGIGRNITVRKLGESALLTQKVKLAQIIDACPIPMFVIDENHRVTHLNSACENVMSVKAEQIIGTSSQWSMFYPSARPVLADVVMNEGGRMLDELTRHYLGRARYSQLNSMAIECEDFFPTLGSDGRWLHFTAAPLKNPDGKTIGAVETLLDITERRRIENAELELNKDLTKSNSELSDTLSVLQRMQNEFVRVEKLAGLGSLVAGISHEINTPVGNALLAVSTLANARREFQLAFCRGITKTDLNRFLDSMRIGCAIAEKNLQRTSELVSSFKQVAVDQTNEQRRRFELVNVVEEILLTMSPILRTSNSVVVNEVISGLWMNSHPGALGQVLMNLINNSLIHGFEGRENGQIVISAEQSTGEYVKITFADDGHGIARECTSKIFDPFFTTKFGQGGSGLGLYIVHNIVTALLGGRIEVNADVAQGCIFYIELPLCAPAHNGNSAP